MSHNTKARHQEILSAAKELLKNIDVTQDYHFAKLAKQLKAQTSCHISSARNNLAKAARLKRGEMEEDNWGGAGRGQGRYPEIKKTCACYLCDAPVEITVYVAFSSDEDCIGVCCDACAERIK